jgi:zinc protease
VEITQENLTNQQGVVKNEVLVNVLNQPYGGFPWLDTPQAANENWFNAHNFYGDLEDLDAATLEDVRSFFRTYYSPNNAALVVTGTFDAARTKEWIQQYFGEIPAQPRPARPDLTEPRQTAEKRVVKQDAKATRPALAVAYHAPAPGTPEYYAMAMLNQILGEGRDSRLYHALVQERGLTGGVSSGINLLGNPYNINGPVLWDVWLFHDRAVSADSILGVMESVIAPLRTQRVDQETLDRALVKIRSDLYDQVESSYGFGRMDLLATSALFHDDPGRVNRIESEFRKVTPELLQTTAAEYLRTTNRTVVVIEPAAPAAQGGN